MFSGRQRPLWSGQWVFWQSLEGQGREEQGLGPNSYDYTGG